MPKKMTIRDVAEAAEVGIGTVSRVINNSPHVSDDTRQRVLDVIHEMGYKPNAVARQLPRGVNFQTIGVITPPFVEYYSFAERLRGVQEALRPYEDEYELTLYTTDSIDDYDERFNSIVETSVMDGLLVIDFNLTPEQKKTLRGLNIPFVGLNHYQVEDWLSIGTDNEAGGYMATQHLIELGHERIGYVGNRLIDDAGFPTSKERYTGYRRALRDAGLPHRKAYVQLGDVGYDPAQQMMHTLLSLPTPPTAIFAMSDTQALGCLAAAREADLRVPDDISIIGYDDLEVSYLTGLTTVRQHLEQSGLVGMQTLLRLLNGEALETTPQLPPIEVVVRHTTAPPRASNDC